MQMSTIRVCISGGEEADCKRALTRAYGSSNLEFTCNKRSSDIDCLESIRNSEDDVTIVGGKTGLPFSMFRSDSAQCAAVLI